MVAERAAAILQTGVATGFHGHNKVGLAMANAAAAIAAGATSIDSSLRGMGRGAGNLPTEQLAAAGRLWK